jgi:hypothetical protein
MATVKRTGLIDPELVRQAKRVTGARTGTETVMLALRDVIVRDEIDKAFKGNSAVLADLEVVFPDPPPNRRSR